MAFRTDLDAMVLAALQVGPLHGYGIVRAIRERSEGVFKLGEGQLYPILHRLEEDGQVVGDWEMQEGKPPRKVYAISEKGSASLVNRRKEWTAFSKAVGNVMHEASVPRSPKEAKGNA
ncbi:MAG: helix-turn-helix transcriptional regulator [Fimbriimonadaceae bacterium]